MSRCEGGLVCYNGGKCEVGSDGKQRCRCPRNFNGEGCIYKIPGQPAGPGTDDVTVPDHIGDFVLT